MRALVLTVTLIGGLAFGFWADRHGGEAQAGQVCEGDARMRRALDAFHAYIGSTREKLKVGRTPCEELRRDHRQFESTANFFVLFVGIYRSPWRKEFDGIAAEMAEIKTAMEKPWFDTPAGTRAQCMPAVH